MVFIVRRIIQSLVVVLVMSLVVFVGVHVVGDPVYILISDDDNQDRILEAAVARGATELWRNHYWREFNGFCGAFVDPWGTEIILWGKAGNDPTIPEGFTSG